VNLGMRKSQDESLAFLFGGKLRHNSQDKSWQKFLVDGRVHVVRDFSV